VTQKPGIVNKDHFHWMATQTQKECGSVAGRHGYAMFDEMAIQVTKICIILKLNKLVEFNLCSCKLKTLTPVLGQYIDIMYGGITLCC
jgi:hypothetical protein